jgi:hypothetical protein
MKFHKLAWLFLVPLFVIGCLVAPTITLADTFDEGIVYDLGRITTAGDVVICETASPCDDTNTSNWSDVLVFYNSANTPFVADSTQDANAAVVFSDSLTGTYSLANFLANYGGVLSSNHVLIVENPTGPTTYGGGYVINSAETTATPEPGSLLLLGSGLLGLAGFRRKKLLA